MKLWLLKVKDEEQLLDDVAGYVIREETEQLARQRAKDHNSGHNSKEFLDPDKTICEELKPDGTPGIIIEDYRECC